MTYVGALKSAIAAACFAASGAVFDLASWRLLGIGFVAAGLAVCILLAYPSWSLGGTVVFAALFLSDSMVLLGSRHDWGPGALALAMRLVLIGAWLAGERATVTRPRNSLLVGILVGLSIFEKLTNVVLLAALPVLMARRVRLDGPAHLRALVGGAVLGGSPLIALNAASWWSDGRLVSIDVPPWAGAALPFPRQVWSTLGVGLGAEVGKFILDTVPPFSGGAYPLVPAAVLLVFGWLSLRGDRSNPSLRAARTLLAAYALIVVAIRLLPRSTFVHHWVIPTPFQYAGLAAVIAGRGGQTGARPVPRAGRIVATGSLLLLIAIQSANLFAVERALRRGRSSPFWDPSLADLGRFVAARVPAAKFIATDWGVGTQMVAFANGAPDAVEEIFWSERGVDRIAGIAREAHGRDLYFVAKRPPLNGDVSRDVVRRVQAAVAAHPCLEPLPVEPEVSTLAAAELRKVRVRAACRAD